MKTDCLGCRFLLFAVILLLLSSCSAVEVKKNQLSGQPEKKIEVELDKYRDNLVSGNWTLDLQSRDVVTSVTVEIPDNGFREPDAVFDYQLDTRRLTVYFKLPAEYCICPPERQSHMWMWRGLEGVVRVDYLAKHTYLGEDGEDEDLFLPQTARLEIHFSAVYHGKSPHHEPVMSSAENIYKLYSQDFADLYREVFTFKGFASSDIYLHGVVKKIDEKYLNRVQSEYLKKYLKTLIYLNDKLVLL